MVGGKKSVGVSFFIFPQFNSLLDHAKCTSNMAVFYAKLNDVTSPHA